MSTHIPKEMHPLNSFSIFCCNASHAEFPSSSSDSSPGEFTALLVDSPSMATGSDLRPSGGRGAVSSISVSSTSTPEFLCLGSSPLTKRHVETGAPGAPRTVGTFSLDEGRDLNSRDSSLEGKRRRLVSASNYMAHMAIEAARGFVAQPQPTGSDAPAAIFLVVVWMINFCLLSVSGGPQAIACGQYLSHNQHLCIPSICLHFQLFFVAVLQICVSS